MARQPAVSREALSNLKQQLSPKLYREIESQLGDVGVRDESVLDNQNQNQGSLEELAQLKPDVLKAITIGVPDADELMDNQNQNQGKLEDLLTLKPAVLARLRVTLKGGHEVMDNQNQNQGEVADGFDKPPSE